MLTWGGQEVDLAYVSFCCSFYSLFCSLKIVCTSSFVLCLNTQWSGFEIVFVILKEKKTLKIIVLSLVVCQEKQSGGDPGNTVRKITFW